MGRLFQSIVLVFLSGLLPCAAQDRGPCCDNPAVCRFCEQKIDQNGICIASRCPQGFVTARGSGSVHMRLYDLTPQLQSKIQRLIDKEAK